VRVEKQITSLYFANIKKQLSSIKQFIVLTLNVAVLNLKFAQTVNHIGRGYLTNLLMPKLIPNVP
jgi:hypothetical protein